VSLSERGSKGAVRPSAQKDEKAKQNITYVYILVLKSSTGAAQSHSLYHFLLHSEVLSPETALRFQKQFGDKTIPIGRQLSS
jgi:hypothetical protein